MFFRNLVAPTIALLAVASQVQAHCIFTPALGVSGTPVRNDVQRPSAANPCGTVSLADIDTSTAAVATNGLFNVLATNFNGGVDGATALKSATVDTTGTGKSFPGTVTIVKNGNPNPAGVAPATLQLQLPAGTTCTGGTTKNKCLVAVVSDGGFGNCLAVTNSGATGATPAAATTGGTNTTTTSTGTGATGGGTTTGADITGAANTTSTTTAKHPHHHHKAAKSREEARNARTLVDSLQRKARAVRSWSGLY